MKQLKVRVRQRKKAAFFDRDGVINVDKGYVGSWCDFQFVEGIFDVLKYVADNDFLIFIVTNQSGIARGYYTESDFLLLTDKMLAALTLNDVYVEKVYYCPHHKDYGDQFYRGSCYCRKPKPGMILEAASDFDLDLGGSILIGDKISDIDSANAAGIRQSFLLNDKLDVDCSNVTRCNDVYALLKSVKDHLKNSAHL